MNKWNDDGFTLIELMIAVTISLIVGATLIILLSYSSDNMSKTQKKVSIQEESKDIMNHINSYGMEGSYATCSAIGAPIPTLVIQNKHLLNSDPRKEVVYWQIGEKIYFAPTKDVTMTNLQPDDKHLLGEQVLSFQPNIKKNPKNDKLMIDVKLKMKNTDVTFDSSYLVYLRNQ